MEVKIKLPNIEDYKRVNELAKQVHELHVSWRPDLFASVDEVIPKRQYKNLIKNERIYVVKLDEKIVGYIIIRIKDKKSVNKKFKDRRYLIIETMCVDEFHRGQGIGTYLLNYAKEIAKDNDCTDMYLTVNKENIGAIKTYEKFGFKLKNIAYSMRLDK